MTDMAEIRRRLREAVEDSYGVEPNRLQEAVLAILADWPEQPEPADKLTALAFGVEGGMFNAGLDNETLALHLEKLRASLCRYWPAHRCDCKYGMGDLADRRGEESGCPELRLAIHRLRTGLKTVKEMLKSLPKDDDRLDAIDGICRWCGAVTDTCYCMRDD